MYNDLIPNIARHFFSSILQHEQKSVIEIASITRKFSQEQVAEFLVTLGSNLDAYFETLEYELAEYTKFKKSAIEQLNDPDKCEPVEEFD